MSFHAAADFFARLLPGEMSYKQGRGYKNSREVFRKPPGVKDGLIVVVNAGSNHAVCASVNEYQTTHPDSGPGARRHFLLSAAHDGHCDRGLAGQASESRRRADVQREPRRTGGG